MYLVRKDRQVRLEALGKATNEDSCKEVGRGLLNDDSWFVRNGCDAVVFIVRGREGAAVL